MKLEFSAGGVVYKKLKVIRSASFDKAQDRSSGQESKKLKVLILVGKHSYHHGWVFPKGLIGDKDDNRHQTKEETAVREVKEETGIDGKIENELEPVEYTYVWEGEKIKKTVYYYTMVATGGDINDRDYELEEVEWIDISEVANRLTYPSDRKVWKEAQKFIE